MLGFDEDIINLRGIGEKTAALYHKVGVFSLWDLLMYLPRDYEVLPDVSPVKGVSSGEIAALNLTIKTNPSDIRLKGLRIISVLGFDDTGEIQLTWFNLPYIKATVKAGSTGVFYGKVSVAKNGLRLVLDQPKIYKWENYERERQVCHPIYPLTSGLTLKSIRKSVSQAFTQIPEIEDYLSDRERDELHLPPLDQAIRTIHSPNDLKEVRSSRDRLAFDEFLSFLISIERIKSERLDGHNGFVIEKAQDTEKAIAALPYELTSAQMRVWNEIMKDLENPVPMNRLVQGDVGSGKTIIAFLSLIMAAANGHQGVLMAPTEVLVMQHAKKLSELLDKAGLDIATEVLTGSLPLREKRSRRKRISSGEAKIVIGTHALIQEGVKFANLGVVITDEQHRFGVRQRLNLASRNGKASELPNVLVMSATPIPRTLALILYGDLDISIIDKRPDDRLPIKNCVVGPEYRKKAYAFIEKEISAGRQAYIVCPQIGPGEDGGELENVEEYMEKLQGAFGNRIRIGSLHGRMKNDEKNQIMDSFKSHELDLIVSTTVIEVGVDVPNATVMMIENAERFGLAQLHQLRGRVGRGGCQGYTIFIDTSKGQGKNARLEILNKSNDGFEIANEDLKLRGAGELSGIRQSGEMGFRIADIYRDAGLLRLAALFLERGGDELIDRFENNAAAKHFMNMSDIAGTL
ncbi:MAG: ATP-dependent DNA helicase RecG [Lachnospiraceae bacterium]|nr:ATP-dependent DNA helicase RecG [Lachnospiraceae bacterium]